MPLIGYIDILSRDRISGWVRDEDLSDVPVGLVVSASGRVIGRCLANHFRPDLVETGNGNGYSGYELLLAEPLSPLRAYEIGIRREGDGAHVPGSPRTLAATRSLDGAARLGIQQLVSGLDVSDMPAALAFFAEQTDRLRGILAADQSGQWDRQHRRGLGWQEPGLSGATDMAGPTTTVPRALVIDDGMPCDGHDAGSDAILSHMRALRRLGYDVTFAPSSLGGDPAALEAEGIATCLHPWYGSVEEILRRQADTFALVYLHRMTNAARYVGLARQHQPKARVIYSVADLHHLRSARQAKIEDRPELLRLSERQRITEIAAAWQSDAVITHSSHEAQLLRGHMPAGKVHVVPWSVPPRPTTAPFGKRRGLAFIGGYAHQPNADAARFLVEQIMPQVFEQDASLPCLLVGSAMPPWLRALAGPPIEALGAIPDLADVFARVRLTVAPLAFGAGIKGKVIASLAAGIPCVCTSIAAEGLDLPPPLGELIADDASSLASIILRLDSDEEHNARCAQAGLDYVVGRLSDATMDQLMRGAVK